MFSRLNYRKNNKGFVWLVKAVLCIGILLLMIEPLRVNGIKPYFSYQDYSFQNNFSEGNGLTLDGVLHAEQSFLSKGNILNSVSVYLGDLSDEAEIEVQLRADDGREISACKITAAEYSRYSWNKVHGLSTDNLARGNEYKLCFSCSQGLSCLVTSSENVPIVFGECLTDGSRSEGQLAVGVQTTYKYLTLGSWFELIIATLGSVLSGVALCFVVIQFEAVLDSFRTGNREGFLPALYFAVSTVLLYNPLDKIRNEVSAFGRVIGHGLIANVDVAKRTSNFSRWFILFAFAFAAFYLAANYYVKKTETEGSKQCAAFLSNYMVLANCCLLLKIITYFNDAASNITAVYSFTNYAVMLVSLIAICYIVAGIDRRIDLKNYARLHFVGASISLPIAIIIAKEWGGGRVLLGVWFLIALLTIIYCKLMPRYTGDIIIEKSICCFSFAVSFVPLLTSLYIELIHVLNQYYIFVAHPAKYYKIAILLFTIVSIVGVIGFQRSQIDFERYSGWVAPIFLLGIACLSIQIPISSTYNPDLFEGANYSILISDFLNFGTIPIVQHYGGHMMTSVWEGILYGIINHDYYGALVSPYSSLIVPVLVVLFYSLIKAIWDEKSAFFSVLFFPFYGYFSYYGLGALICVAAIAYTRKNTYSRAMLLWGAFIWCALYRLDLGFAFGVALAFSLITYVIVFKNWQAARQLSITLGTWGVLGILLWSIICVAKNVNPINRLLEFLAINLSNQNWAYTGIGNAANTLFGWSYIIIPFIVALGLLYTTLSKTMREQIGAGTWIVLLITGWSYFANFSRGLVRHSLAETATTIVIWSGYLFLAMFFSVYRNKKKLFLPTFMMLMLCNTLFVQDGNFTSASVAESAMIQPFSIVESWKPTRFSEEENGMTYWEKVKHDREKIDRVVLNPNLIQYAEKYETVMNTLLKKEETFVDFTNKTLLYSLLKREDPVYVSQSPLQLSGEFTQKEFIKEMIGVPLVVMPVDIDNFRASNSLDGITNAYRYYKIAEYIFQNYAPLCQYENDYAIWCLKDRTAEFEEKTGPLVVGTDYLSALARGEGVGKGNVELVQLEDGTVELSFTGRDPMITELQNVIDISDYIDSDMTIHIDYVTDIAGPMQIFYTTDEGESYVGGKVATANINGSGTAYFTIPITQYSRIRLDTPEGSKVILKSLIATRSPVRLIDYGYDGPFFSGESYAYISALHNHNLNQLPRIWAEGDKKKAVENPVIVDAELDNGVYSFDSTAINKANGNYCLISVSYDGVDTNGLFEEDDEQIAATIIFGNQSGTAFEEKCRYSLSLKEGTHDYLIRCSTDYYWYLNQINAFKIAADGEIYNVSAHILEGD